MLLERYSKILAFGLVGLTASAVYVLVFSALGDVYQLNSLISTVIAYSIALPVSYFGHRYISFRSKNAMFFEITRFLVSQFVGLSICLLITLILNVAFNFGHSISGVVSALAVPCISYVLFKLWVYRENH